VALYSYTDKIKSRYYIGESPNFTPKELIFQTYLNRDYDNAADLDRRSRTITENTFQRQLNDVASRANELTDKLMLYIHTLEYTEDNMLKIASKLNHIDKAAYEKKRNLKSPYQIIVGAGLNFTGYEPGGFHQYNIDRTYYSSVQPLVSAGITLFPGPNTRRLMFRFEVVLSDGTYKAFLPYKIFEASFVPQVLYNLYNGENFKFFAGAGISGDTFSYSDPQYATIKRASAFHVKAGFQAGQNVAFQIQYISSSTGAISTQFGVNYIFK
jgi:hypothetical protein